MARANNQKGKILYLERLLRGATESRPLSMQTIITELERVGVTAERKSLYDDLEVLREFGLDVQFRRGKHGGYYLRGQDAEDTQLSFQDILKEEQPKGEEEKPVRVEIREVKVPVPAPDKFTRGWKFTGPFKKGKQIKLSCQNAIRNEIEELFGKDAGYKEKEVGRFQITVDILEDEQFYGWLTAMGTSVRIVKPKKTAQAYRDYLKNLAKEYKGI